MTLRPDLSWHDGEPLTSEDVAFTYRFVRDTSLGSAAAEIPAPHLLGRSSLVWAVDPIDERRLDVEFGDTQRAVSRRALTVPILPKHVWEPMATVQPASGVTDDRPLTEALPVDNPTPVGSGPLAVRRRETEEALVLERVPGRFLGRADDSGRLDYEVLRLQLVPPAQAAVAVPADGTVDATMSLADGSVVPNIGEAGSLRLDVDTGTTLYHVGFTIRREPLGNPGFRRAVARLLDKRDVTEEFMSGFGTPAATAFPVDGWPTETLESDGTDPAVLFVGDDGQPRAAAVRDMFREIGSQYAGDRVVQP